MQIKNLSFDYTLAVSRVKNFINVPVIKIQSSTLNNEINRKHHVQILEEVQNEIVLPSSSEIIYI
jgi:hypothetical protein